MLAIRYLIAITHFIPILEIPKSLRIGIVIRRIITLRADERFRTTCTQANQVPKIARCRKLNIVLGAWIIMILPSISIQPYYVGIIRYSSDPNFCGRGVLRYYPIVLTFASACVHPGANVL